MRSGSTVFFLKTLLSDAGVDATHVAVDPEHPSGHTVIQVTPKGENAILYYAGTNATIDAEFVRGIIGAAGAEDAVLLQNETSAVADIIDAALEKGLRVIFNPAPFDDSVTALPLERLFALCLNVTEACGILGLDPEVDGSRPDAGERMLAALAAKFPKTVIILTLGSKGALWVRPGEAPGFVAAFPVEAVDTTGAGDTFAGYAVRALLSDDTDEAAFATGMRFAAMAAALSVTKPGAANSIPMLDAVKQALAANEARDF